MCTKFSLVNYDISQILECSNIINQILINYQNILAKYRFLEFI